MFEFVSFSKTHIHGIIFRNCTFRHCLFIGAFVDGCEFHKCEFVSVNTHKIKIERTYIDPRSFEKCLDRRRHQNIGAHLYHALLKNSRDEDQIEFQRSAQFLFLRWKRHQDGHEVSSLCRENKFAMARKFFWKCLIGYLLRLSWEQFFGSGVRIRYYMRTLAVIVILFSAINYCFRDQFGLPVSNCVDALYFTVISLTTVGYGDIVPATGYGKFASSIQSVFGFILFALLASMLFRRVCP